MGSLRRGPYLVSPRLLCHSIVEAANRRQHFQVAASFELHALIEFHSRCVACSKWLLLSLQLH